MQRYPQPRAGYRKEKIGRHDAYNLPFESSQRQVAADHVRATTESVLPQLVAEDDDAVVSRAIFSRMKGPSDRSRRPQEMEQICGYGTSGEMRGLSAPGKIELRIDSKSGHIYRLALLLQLNYRALWIITRHSDQSLGLQVWKGAEEDRIYEAEQCGVGAYAESERKKCSRRESGMTGEGSQRITRVFEQAPDQVTDAPVANLFFDLFDASELDQRLPMSVFRTDSGPDFLVGQQ